MNMMKKLLCLLLVFLLSVFFIGCSEQSDEESRLSVVCTVFPQYDFVRNITGDKVSAKMLVPLGTESHDFQLENLTVSELKTVAAADLVIYVGGESDSDWITELRHTVKGNARWIALTDTVDTLSEVISGSMEHVHEDAHSHEDEHDHEHDAYDEHVWTSPKRSVEIVKAITEVLCELDSDNAQYYKANCQAYVSELQKLDEELLKVVSDAKAKRLIFGDRFPFRYLCDDYDLDYDAAFLGCSSGVDPSVAQITALTKSALESNTKVIFYMENSDPVFAKQIASAVGGKAELLHSCHTFSKQELTNGADYVSVMRENINKISEALK